MKTRLIAYEYLSHLNVLLHLQRVTVLLSTDLVHDDMTLQRLQLCDIMKMWIDKYDLKESCSVEDYRKPLIPCVQCFRCGVSSFYIINDGCRQWLLRARRLVVWLQPVFTLRWVMKQVVWLQPWAQSCCQIFTSSITRINQHVLMPPLSSNRTVCFLPK